MAEGKDPVGGRPNGGGRSREIAADIDRTRDALDRTVDAIVGKLTPSQLLGELVGVLRSGSSSVMSRVVEAAREHPVPATIVAAGVGMMLWERSQESAPRRATKTYEAYDYGYQTYESRRDEGTVQRVKDKAQDLAAGVGDTVEGVRETMQEKAQQAREGAQHAREAVSEKLHEARETTHQATEAVREKLHGVKEGVRQEAQHLRESARRQVKDARIGFWQTMDQQPLVVGGIAMALGAAAALLVPRTEREDELMGEASERLKDRAEDVGRQVLEKGKDVARTAAEVLRDQAREQGLAPDQLADKVRTVARETEQRTVDKAERELEPVGGAGSWSSGGPGIDRG